MRLALYQPDIPQNTGTLLRLSACMGIGLDIIEPCGFILDDRRLKRAGMDYIDLAAMKRHNSWQSFEQQRKALSPAPRLVLLTTKATTAYSDFTFQPDDILLLGQESCGAPREVHDAADARIIVPMAGGVRSLNIAISAAMVLGEALRQTSSFPKPDSSLKP